MSKKFVDKVLCDERFNRIMEKLESIEQKLINDLMHLEVRVKALEEDNTKQNTLKAEAGTDYRKAALQMLTGAAIVFITWILNRYI